MADGFTAAFDAQLGHERIFVAAPERAAGDFRRGERLVVLVGAIAFGAIAGFAIAMSTGRPETWLLVTLTAPFYLLALHLTAQTLTAAFSREAYGCASASALHAAALLAWPVGILLAPFSGMAFAAAPIAALTSLILLASCWAGPARAVYRTGLQGALVTGLAVHQGMLILMAS